MPISSGQQPDTLLWAAGQLRTLRGTAGDLPVQAQHDHVLAGQVRTPVLSLQPLLLCWTCMQSTLVSLRRRHVHLSWRMMYPLLYGSCTDTYRPSIEQCQAAKQHPEGYWDNGLSQLAHADRKLSSSQDVGPELHRGYQAPDEGTTSTQVDVKAEAADNAAARQPVNCLLLCVHGIGQNLSGQPP